MKILDIRTLRGPNYWSVYRKKLIDMKLDLGDKEHLPTDKIEDFADILEKLMPSLKSHRCSPGEEGGFLKRVREGTWLGHVVEHLALELQTLADMECGFGRTRSTSEPGIYHVVFAYEIDTAGVYAGKAAVRIVDSLINNSFYDFEKDVYELRRIKSREGLGPSTLAIVNEAAKRDIPWTRLDNNSLVMLGQGSNQKIIDATVACTTSSVAADLVSDKELTRKILSGMYITFPDGVEVEHESEIEDAINELGYPLVVKPVYGNHGRGITTRLQNREQVLHAFRNAQSISEQVIIEKYVPGNDYRLLMINYKLAAAAMRIPAMIIGDGVSTIEQLIDQTNTDPRRGDGHENILTKIILTHDTLEILNGNSLTLNSILPPGKILYLKDTANLSSGGTAFDVTDSVHPKNVIIAERIARLIGLDICGLDMIANDLSIPLTRETGALLEINAAPGFRMHLFPASGKPRNVAEKVIDMLYPANAQSRIPIVAVTGTNGKTTTARLIAHFAKAAGHNTGYTTTDGIYINNEEIYHGDCSGPESAASVLRDPLVNFAVFECARGGILRAGLGFDKCNVGIVTNLTGDHLGLKDINTLEQLADVKSVVPRSVMDNGYAILNADDDLVYKMREDLDCKVALFSTSSENPRIIKHCADGGVAAITEKGYFVVCKDRTKINVAKVSEVPLTFSGRSDCMIQNILPAVLTALVCNFSLRQTASALKTFIPSPELTPGRMNIFRFKKFTLLLDYAHNEGAFIELKKYLSSFKASIKTGILSATGDRRDEDIRKVGFYAAQMFDELIIKHDIDSRGRNNDELTTLIVEGVKKVRDDMPITIITDELTAVKHAIEKSVKNSIIVVCAEDVTGVIELVKKSIEDEAKVNKHSMTLLKHSRAS